MCTKFLKFYLLSGGKQTEVSNAISNETDSHAIFLSITGDRSSDPFPSPLARLLSAVGTCGSASVVVHIHSAEGFSACLRIVLGQWSPFGHGAHLHRLNWTHVKTRRGTIFQVQKSTTIYSWSTYVYVYNLNAASKTLDNHETASHTRDPGASLAY